MGALGALPGVSCPDQRAFGCVRSAVAGRRDDIVGDQGTGGDRNIRAVRSEGPGSVFARWASVRVRPRRTDARDSGALEATP